MPVQDVNNPATREITNPIGAGRPIEGEGSRFWEEKEKTSRSKREYEESERAARQARDAENNPPAESPFQIKGSIDLGNMDLQKNAEDLRITIHSIQKDARDREDKLIASAADYRDKVAEIRNQMIENTMKAQVDAMQKELSLSRGSPTASAMGHINEVIQLAGILGYAKPDPAVVTEQVPAMVQLQILKMEMEEKGRVRQFEWDKIESERNWQLAIKRLELESQGKRDEMVLEREKRSSWISPFEAIGAAIARGVSDMGTEAADEEAPAPKIKKQTKAKEPHRLQAGMNDTGTIPCPECQEPIAIAPRSKSAFCPACEANIDIQRIASTDGNLV